MNPEQSDGSLHFPTANRLTAELVNALHAVNRHVPSVATALLAGSLPMDKQHEFGGLLTDLGELLHSHADDQHTGIIPAHPTSSNSDDSHPL